MSIRYSLGTYVNTTVNISSNGQPIRDALASAGWSVSGTRMFSADPTVDQGFWQPLPMPIVVGLPPTQGTATGTSRDEFFSEEQPNAVGVLIGPLLGTDASASNFRGDTTSCGTISCDAPADPTTPNCCKVDWGDVREVYRTYAALAGTHRIIANKFSYWIFPEDPIQHIVAGGLLYLEKNDNPTSGRYSWWTIGSITGVKLLDTTIASLRTVPTTQGSPSFYRHTNGLACRDGAFYKVNPDPCPCKSPTPRRALSNQSTITLGTPKLLRAGGASSSYAQDYKWHNKEPIKFGTRLTFGQGSPSDPLGTPTPDEVGQVRGQIYDCVTIMGPQPANKTTTFDGHTWYNIMHDGEMGLWVVTS